MKKFANRDAWLSRETQHAAFADSSELERLHNCLGTRGGLDIKNREKSNHRNSHICAEHCKSASYAIRRTARALKRPCECRIADYLLRPARGITLSLFSAVDTVNGIGIKGIVGFCFQRVFS